MSIEEKEAERIIEMYFRVNSIDNESSGTNPYISREYSKQCALIHVQGIIEANHRIDNKHFPSDKTLDILVDEFCYWKRVLEIIINK